MDTLKPITHIYRGARRKYLTLSATVRIISAGINRTIAVALLLGLVKRFLEERNPSKEE